MVILHIKNRSPINVDDETGRRVLAAKSAAEHHIQIEINGKPIKLNLDEGHRQA